MQDGGAYMSPRRRHKQSLTAARENEELQLHTRFLRQPAPNGALMTMPILGMSIFA